MFKILSLLIGLSPIVLPQGDKIEISCPAAIVCPPVAVCPPPVVCPVCPPTTPPQGTQGTVYDAKALGIQNAINASKPGDTILFPAGTYNLTSMLVIPSGRMLYSNAGAILHGVKPYAVNSMGQIKVIGLTFDSTGIKFDGNTDGSLIDNNVFKTVDSDALYSGARLVNTKVTNNLFTNFQHFSFMTYGSYSGLVIANNEFINVMAGPHVDGQQGAGSILMEQNYFSGVGLGPFSELQGVSTSAVIQDNWSEKPVLTPNQGCSVQPNNCYAIGHSDPLNGSASVVIQRNVIIAPERPDGIGVRYGFELGGKSTMVENNWVEGTNVAFANTDGTTANGIVTVKNNYVLNPLRISEFSFPSSGRQMIVQNNGTMNEAALKYLKDRGRPARNKRF